MKLTKLKKLFSLTILTALSLAIVGCADVAKQSKTGRKFEPRAAFCPAGVVAPTIHIHPDTNGNDIEVEYKFTPCDSNGLSSVKSVSLGYFGWIDYTKGGAKTLLADPKASAIASQARNQTDLGGGHEFNVGEVASVVSTNGISAVGDATSKIVDSVGNAAGKFTGSAVKSAAGVP